MSQLSSLVDQWVECPRYNRRYAAKLDISGRSKILHRYTEKLESSGTGQNKLHYIEKYDIYFLHINYTNFQLVSILKEGKDAKSPTSYRPISRLNCLDKVFEKTVLQKINEYTETNNIIQNEQYGIRKEHSTVHQVKGIVYFISNNKSTRKSTGKVLLDVEKAFDSIQHNGLIFKFDKFGYLIYLQKMVQSSLMKDPLHCSKISQLYCTQTILPLKQKVKF